MVAARRADSATKRARVLAAIEHLDRAGTPITPTAVARHAKVSTWLVHTAEMRAAIQAAQARQAAAETCAQPPSQGSVTELALARAEISRLRTERRHHDSQLQKALGARLDDLAKVELVERVDDLSGRNHELVATVGRLQADNTGLGARVAELEDDLAAARTSLRRMMRAENRPASPTTPNGDHR